MMAVSNTSTNASAAGTANDLILRFHEDCSLRGMVSTMDYIYRAKEYCVVLDSRGKDPLNADRDDLRVFLAQLKTRGLKFKTIDRIYSCLSAFYEFLIIDGLVEYNPILPFRKYYLRRYKHLWMHFFAASKYSVRQKSFSVP